MLWASAPTDRLVLRVAYVEPPVAFEVAGDGAMATGRGYPALGVKCAGRLALGLAGLAVRRADGGSVALAHLRALRLLVLDVLHRRLPAHAVEPEGVLSTATTRARAEAWLAQAISDHAAHYPLVRAE